MPVRSSGRGVNDERDEGMLMMVWFAAKAASKNERQPLRNGKFTVSAKHNIIVITAVALAAFLTVSHAQTGVAPSQTGPTPPEQSAPVADAAPASDGLSDLGAMTFSCPRAGLNAAAREA